MHRPDLQPYQYGQHTETLGPFDQQNTNYCLFVLLRFVTILYTLILTLRLRLMILVNF